MWGVTGVLYNPEKMTEEEASTWDVFLNDKFKRQVTIKDNVRDSYFAALGSYRKDELMDESLRNAPDYQERLMQIMNDVDSDTIENVEDILQDMQGNVYSFETDSGKADMISGKREMRKYRWNLIWKVVLVNAVALVAFMAVSLWVRGKANVEIGNYFTDARTSVQDYIISALSDPGLLEAREKLIENKIEIRDRQETSQADNQHL